MVLVKIVEKNFSWLRLAVILLIVLTGVYLRLINIFHATYFFGDTSRDMLIAKHIANYRDIFFVYPDANGGQNILTNTPLYYWILSAIWFVSNSETGTIIIFCLIGIANILTAYFIVREFSNRLSAMLLPYFIAISTTMILTSIIVSEAHLVPFFQLLSILFLFKSFKKKRSILYSFLAIQCAFIATDIHLSYIPLMLITIIILLINLVIEKEIKGLMIIFIISLINFVLYKTLAQQVPRNIYVEPLVIPNSLHQFIYQTQLNIKILAESLLSDQYPI